MQTYNHHIYKDAIAKYLFTIEGKTNKKYSMLELQNLEGFIDEKSQDSRSIDEIVYGT